MWRLFWVIVVDVIIGTAWDWVSEEYFNSESGNNGSYSKEVYERPRTQQLVEKVEEYELVPYKFNVEDLNTIFAGIYNYRVAKMVFSEIELSKNKDTVFFEYSIITTDKNHYLDYQEGCGFVVSNEELIVLKRDKDGFTLSGNAFKVFDNEYANDNEDGYLLFSIFDQGERLSFIDKKLRDEIEKTY